jgi:hypothetical protein
MDITRRDFIGHAAASVAIVALHRKSLGRRAKPDGGVVVLAEHCRNPESLAGYQAALKAAPIAGDGLVILPAATTIPDATVRVVHDRLRSGATIIFESGAGFLSDGADEFQRHRALLEESFGIRVHSPVGLWPGRGIPYVEYVWPRPTLIRDYSRVVPVTARAAVR